MAGGPSGVRPNFTDLMMWAVLAGQHELASVLWEKTADPIRSALMASQLCHRLSINHLLRADSEALNEQTLACAPPLPYPTRAAAGGGSGEGGEPFHPHPPTCLR